MQSRAFISKEDVAGCCFESKVVTTYIYPYCSWLLYKDIFKVDVRWKQMADAFSCSPSESGCSNCRKIMDIYFLGANEQVWQG